MSAWTQIASDTQLARVVVGDALLSVYGEHDVAPGVSAVEVSIGGALVAYVESADVAEALTAAATRAADALEDAARWLRELRLPEDVAA